MKNKENFDKWLEQFIEESGHAFGMGFYIQLKTGELFYRNDTEYLNWYNNKKEEYEKHRIC